MTNNTTPTTTTRRIAGHTITLTSGEWYLASRPMACRGRTDYPITIEDERGATALTLAPMSYDDANAFLAKFNNGAISFDGRTW
jgi:hypothetical protein